MPSTSALTIAIVGGGNIGSTFAFQLAGAGGHHVTVIGRPDSPRLRQLQRDGAIVDIHGARAPVQVDAQLDVSIAYDLVIVTTPIHQVDAVIPALQRSAAVRILTMFNQFDPMRMAGLCGAARCDFGMPFVQASLDAQGRLRAVIGAGGQKTKLGNQRWVDMFNDAGLPAVMEPDMPRWLRCHAPLCVAFESIAVSATRRGKGASWTEATVVARGMYAAFALIRSSGERVYPANKAWLSASPHWVAAAVLWSVSRIASFRVLLAQGAGECHALADRMAAAARMAQRAADAASITAMKPAQRNGRLT